MSCYDELAMQSTGGDNSFNKGELRAEGLSMFLKVKLGELE